MLIVRSTPWWKAARVYYQYARDYVRYHLYRLEYICTAPHPRKLLHVNPNSIEYVIADSAHHPFNPEYSIRTGDWDTNKFLHKKTKKHQSMIRHFTEGVPWEQTSRYEDVVTRIKRGERVGGFDGSEQTVEQYEEYLSWINELYNSIKEEGYKSQRELSAEDDFMRRTHLVPEYNEITVDIDRHGNFLATHGIHRLSIAKLLDVETVPVRVRVRHKKWQEIRVQFHNNYPDSIPEELEQYESHPDIRTIVQSN